MSINEATTEEWDFASKAATYLEIEAMKDKKQRSKNGSSSTQVGGDHYSKLTIQPVEYIEKNQLTFLQGNVIKYTTRCYDKGGVEDINKAIHCLELMRDDMRERL